MCNSYRALYNQSNWSLRMLIRRVHGVLRIISLRAGRHNMPRKATSRSKVLLDENRTAAFKNARIVAVRRAVPYAACM